MFNQQHLEELAAKLTSALPNEVQRIKEDMKASFLAVLSSTFSKMDLVTREEFDVQTKVLLKTREKLEALEERFDHFVKKKGNHLEK